MPVGANDFSRDWYSYDETEGDFAMNNFSINNERETRIPFIRNAKKNIPDYGYGPLPGVRLHG